MRHDLLKEISASRNITNAIILTHNIDFVFLQTVCLAAFRKCGHPALTIFADAQCAAETYRHQLPVLEGLGVRYRVVPVEMKKPYFRFHPKAFFLAGPESATLFVGSGNLTFGGLRENAEVWARYTTSEDGTAAFAAFHEYLKDIINLVPLSNSIRAEVDEAFDSKTKNWASNMDAASGLLGHAGAGRALIDQFGQVVGDAPVEELLVCVPYFDPDGDALSRLINQTRADRTKVLYQPEKSTLTPKGWKKNKDSAEFLNATFEHKDEKGESRSTFIHAKFYAFLRGEDIILFLGSANCSKAALTISGAEGNAELQAVLQFKQKEFEEEFFQELVLTDNPVEIVEPPIFELEDKNSEPVLRILAARYEFGFILVAFAPQICGIETCIIDGSAVSVKEIGSGIIKAAYTGHPRAIILHGQIKGRHVASAPAWVDHERDLRTTARNRGVADSVKDRLRPGAWSANGMSEILSVFYKGLQYLPKQSTSIFGDGKGGDREQSGPIEFTAADVFAVGYELPSLGSLSSSLPAIGPNKIISLQQLVLRWFGAPGPKEGAVECSDVSEHEEEGEDRPEKLKTTQQSEQDRTKITEKEKNRILKLLSQISEMMTNEEFILERSLELLAADIKMAAVLLRIGYREEWIDLDDFLHFTHKIWLSLFFSCEKDKSVGWLEYRQRNAEDPRSFIEAMMSTELSAALVSWALTVPPEVLSPDYARFQLACALSVARLPWLWAGGGDQEIAQEVASLLSLTLKKDEMKNNTMLAANQLWRTLLQRGYALRRFEAAMRGKNPIDFKDNISQSELNKGELLWQGSAGFCVVVENKMRGGQHDVPVLPLQKKMTNNAIRSDYTIPIQALLSEQMLPLTSEIGPEPRQVLKIFFDTISRGFIGNEKAEMIA